MEPPIALFCAVMLLLSVREWYARANYDKEGALKCIDAKTVHLAPYFKHLRDVFITRFRLIIYLTILCYPKLIFTKT